MKIKKKKKKKEKKSTKGCKDLYIDLFGHPFCTRSEKDAIDCKFSLPSEEYIEMKRQLDKQKENNKDNKIPILYAPSTYRCTIYDNYADSYGHLPEHMRAEMKGNLTGITVEF